jgi:hypothetical protein
MSTTPQFPDDLDAQVAWFHDLAEDVRAGRAVVNSTTCESLGRFLAVFLPEHPLSGCETGREIEEAVRDVRENEVAWNRALQRAIIESHDTFDAGNAGRRWSRSLRSSHVSARGHPLRRLPWTKRRSTPNEGRNEQLRRCAAA